MARSGRQPASAESGRISRLDVSRSHSAWVAWGSSDGTGGDGAAETGPASVAATAAHATATTRSLVGRIAAGYARAVMEL